MGEISEIVGGGTPPSNDELNFSDAGLAWVTPADLTGYRETYIHHGRRDLSQKGYQSSAARLMPAGTVLFSSRAPIGYCAIASREISTNQGFKSFVLRGHVSPEYVRHYLLGSVDYAESKASGTTFKELSGSRAAELSIPISPLPEQRRIVAKIDSLTAQSKRARDHLDHVPRLVEKYKLAILDFAFRETFGRTPLETLVDAKRGIPYGIVQTGLPIENGVPTIRCGDIKNFSVSKDHLKRVSPEIEAGYTRTRLQGGEVLIAIRGTVGEPCVVPSDFIGYNISREVAMIPAGPETVPEFLMYFLASSEARQFILGNVKGVAQQGINLRDLRDLPTPVSPKTEQQEIVRRIETAFTWIDRLTAEATSARKLVDKLDQAVLAKAFRGELVPQDPNDEPASVLLDRIRAERAAAPKAKRGRRKSA
jgi:type I restriction enzyme S subunit